MVRLVTDILEALGLGPEFAVHTSIDNPPGTADEFYVWEDREIEYRIIDRNNDGLLTDPSEILIEKEREIDPEMEGCRCGLAPPEWTQVDADTFAELRPRFEKLIRTAKEQLPKTLASLQRLIDDGWIRDFDSVYPPPLGRTDGEEKKPSRVDLAQVELFRKLAEEKRLGKDVSVSLFDDNGDGTVDKLYAQFLVPGEGYRNSIYAVFLEDRGLLLSFDAYLNSTAPEETEKKAPESITPETRERQPSST